MGTKTHEPKFCKNCVKIQPVVHTPRGKLGGTRDRIAIECAVCEQYLGGYDAIPRKRDANDAPKPSRETPLKDGDQFPFGRFGPEKGDPRKCGDVPAWYLLHTADEDWIDQWPAVKAYIETNRDRLEQEMETQIPAEEEES